MPPEILSKIFIQCQDTAPFDPTDRDGGVHLDKVPFLLGKICSRWRYVSFVNSEIVGIHSAFCGNSQCRVLCNDGEELAHPIWHMSFIHCAENSSRLQEIIHHPRGQAIIYIL